MLLAWTTFRKNKVIQTWFNRKNLPFFFFERHLTRRPKTRDKHHLWMCSVQSKSRHMALARKDEKPLRGIYEFPFQREMALAYNTVNPHLQLNTLQHSLPFSFQSILTFYFSELSEEVSVSLKNLPQHFFLVNSMVNSKGHCFWNIWTTADYKVWV